MVNILEILKKAEAFGEAVDAPLEETIQAPEESKEEADARAKQELISIVSSLFLQLDGDRYADGKKKMLSALMNQYIHGKSLPEVFPNVSRDLAYQWKRRGLNMVMPKASDNLKRFLSDSKWGRKG